jgi:Concanavalin A-like lectin/glucanases superfamily
MKKILAIALMSCCPALCGYGGYILIQTVPSMAGSNPTSPYSLLISGTFPAFATVANGGKVVNTVSCGVDSIICPADLIFAQDSACTAPFGGWEVQAYSSATGQLTVSVEIPTLSNVRPVKVYGCVGNAAITAFQGGSRGAAYDNNYLLALHMEETSGIALHDSTANANDAIKKGTASPGPAASGLIGAAQRFAGTANSANNDNALFLSPTPLENTYTIEYWTDATSYINEDSVFLESSGGAPTIFAGFYWFPGGSVVFENTWNTSLSPGAPRTIPTGSFHYLVFTRNGDVVNVYVDGVAGTPKSGYGTGMERWKGLGWDGGAGAANSFNGVLDEVFFSSVVRSQDYVIARYNNLSNPSAFYSIGTYTANTTAPPSTTRANSQVNVFVF